MKGHWASIPGENERGWETLRFKTSLGSAESIAREAEQPLDVSHIDTVLEVVEAWNIAEARK